MSNKRKLKAKIAELESCVENAEAVSAEWERLYKAAVAHPPVMVTRYCTCVWSHHNTFRWCPIHGQSGAYPYTICGTITVGTGTTTNKLELRTTDILATF